MCIFKNTEHNNISASIGFKAESERKKLEKNCWPRKRAFSREPGLSAVCYTNNRISLTFTLYKKWKRFSLYFLTGCSYTILFNIFEFQALRTISWIFFFTKLDKKKWFSYRKPLNTSWYVHCTQINHTYTLPDCCVWIIYRNSPGKNISKALWQHSIKKYYFCFP